MGSRFIENGNRTITDVHTGLVWQESYAYIDDINIYKSKPKGKIFTFETGVVPWYKWLWNYFFKKMHRIILKS